MVLNGGVRQGGVRPRGKDDGAGISRLVGVVSKVAGVSSAQGVWVFMFPFVGKKRSQWFGP